MENEIYKNFLKDLVTLLKEKLEQSKKENLYGKGFIMGIYETLDLIKSQADTFNIPLSELDLENYNLEKFLTKE